MLNATVHPTKAGFIFDVFHFLFLFCIAKGLAICKFEGVISTECSTFKPFNLHMLISLALLFT
jgi:riboflavin transporter FmnP